MDFVFGKVFRNSYPPEAAIWCNLNGGYIKEIDPKDGVRRFEIFKVEDTSTDDYRFVVKAKFKELQEHDADWYIVSKSYKINANKDSLDTINILINNFDALKTQTNQIVFRTYNNLNVLVSLDDLKTFKKDIELSFIDLRTQYWNLLEQKSGEVEFKHYGE